jgi:hypothetical protein
MHAADAQQDREPPFVQGLEVRAAKLQALHLQIEPETEQERENRVRLVGHQPAQHI